MMNNNNSIRERFLSQYGPEYIAEYFETWCEDVDDANDCATKPITDLLFNDEDFFERVEYDTSSKTRGNNITLYVKISWDEDVDTHKLRARSKEDCIDLFDMSVFTENGYIFNRDQYGWEHRDSREFWDQDDRFTADVSVKPISADLTVFSSNELIYTITFEYNVDNINLVEE